MTTRAAELAPERVDGLVLVDGALPVPVDLPPDTDIEAVIRSVIGPALDRLERTFASPEEYVALWREHPAVGGRYFTDVAEAYVRYDLIADRSVWRSPVDRTAVLEDGQSLLVDDEARTSPTWTRAWSPTSTTTRSCSARWVAPQSRTRSSTGRSDGSGQLSAVRQRPSDQSAVPRGQLGGDGGADRFGR